MDIGISIILVVYNTKKWIEDCLGSIFAQTYPDYELIVISNDPDPGLDALIKGCLDGRENTTYVLNADNVGGAKACNQGLALAKGRYVFFMDSDDRLPAGAFNRLMTKAQETDSDIVIGRGKILRNGKLYNLDYTPDWISWEREVTVESITQAPYLSFNPYYWGRLYRREFLIKNKIRFENGAMNADRYFNCCAFAKAKGISVTPAITYYWRKHDTEDDDYRSITRSRDDRENFLDRIRMMKKADKLFKKKGFEEVYRYSRISGLMRLLILAVDTPENAEFRELFLKEMTKYLKKFKDADISDCEFLTYRVKTIAYLIKHAQYDGFDRFIKGECVLGYNEYENRIVYSYDGVSVPLEFRTQKRFRISALPTTVTETEKSYVFKVGADIRGIKPDVAAVYLMNSHRREKLRIAPYMTEVRGASLKLKFKLKKSKLDILKEDADYYFSLCYVTSGRVSRTKLTDPDGNAIAVSRSGDALEIKNGNYIFEKEEQEA